LKKIQEIKTHPWMQHKDANKKNIFEEMTKRKIVFLSTQN